jgi:hypothetical protein
VVTTVALVGWLLWAHHRRLLGRERTDPVRAHEYSTLAVAVSSGVAAATTLMTTVFAGSAFVGSSGALAISAGVVLVASFLTWLRYWARAQAQPRGVEAASMPRRFYLLGLGVVMALVGAGALIATLVLIFQALLRVESLSDSFVVAVTLFVAAGGVAWHLLRNNADDRSLTESTEVVTPFEVTVICSHPGMLATRFPKEAKTRVIYRSDQQGVIDDEMADAIVAAVGTTNTLVWVDESGFRVAPAR